MKLRSRVLSLRRVITALLCAGAVALVWDTGAQAQGADLPAPPEPTTVTVSVSKPDLPAPPEPATVTVSVSKPDLPAPPEPTTVTVSVSKPDLPSPPEPTTVTVSVRKPDLPAPPESEDAPDDKPSSEATACPPQRLSGTYAASYGPLECKPGGAGLECCYSTNCRWNLHLFITDDGTKLEGTWDHNDGSTGPVEFGVTEDCELSSGQFGYTAGKLTRGWSVTGKSEPKPDEPEKCESFCIEWVCGITGSACAKYGNSCDGDTRRDTRGGNLCGKGCKQGC